MTRRRGLLAVALTAVCWCAPIAAAATLSWTAPVAPPRPVCQSIAVPAYFAPSAAGDPWSVAAAARPGVTAVVANVVNGPGSAADPAYAAAIARARAAGVTVFGYVHTSYGSAPESSVQADITAWRNLYGVTSIFIDEAATTGSALPYYRSLTDFVHRAGGRTIVNFGTVPGRSEMTAGDVLITFEGDYADYARTRFPDWMTAYPPSRFYNIVYDVPDRLAMLSVMREAASAGVGQVYATDDVLPNPYDTVPSYLNAEATQARSGC